MLDECILVGIEAPGAYLPADLIAQSPPAVGRAISGGSLNALHRPVERNPAHQLGMGEVLARPPHLPDTAILVVPMALKVIEQLLLHVPGIVQRLDAMGASGMEAVHDLPVDVELDLIAGRLPNPYPPRPGQSRPPRD